MNENNLIIFGIFFIGTFVFGYAVGAMYKRDVAYGKAWNKMKRLENKYLSLIDKYQAKLEEMWEKKR